MAYRQPFPSSPRPFRGEGWERGLSLAPPLSLSLSALPPLPFRGEGSCSEHPVVVESSARIGNRLHDVPVLADIAVGDPQDVDDRVTGVIRFPAKMEMYRHEIAIAPDDALDLVRKLRIASNARFHHRQRRIAPGGSVGIVLDVVRVDPVEERVARIVLDVEQLDEPLGHLADREACPVRGVAWIERCHMSLRTSRCRSSSARGPPG